MLVGNGLWTVTEIQGFTFYPALIIYAILVGKNNCAHTHPKMLTEVTIIEILQQIILFPSHTQTVTLTVSGFVIIQALLFILRVNILSLGDPV